jgi:YggT family protein
MLDTFCVACFLLVFMRTFIAGLGWALSLAVLARVILSWIRLPLPLGLQRWIFEITEPILAPIRRALPQGALGGLDFSPLIALLIIGLARDVLLMLVPVSLLF